MARVRALSPADVDEDVRSGVYFGMGLITLLLSIFPSSIATIIDILGYKRDREMALDLLSQPGHWGDIASEGGSEDIDGGLRRNLCDLALLAFHLVLSNSKAACSTSRRSCWGFRSLDALEW